MAKNFTVKKTFTTLTFAFLLCFASYSQYNKMDIVKKYHVKDTTLINKDAYLVLYKNNVFVNYGMYNNKKELDWYIWYANGTYQLVNGNVVCQSDPNNSNKDVLIREIKNSYKRRADYILIESDYEFVYEKCNDKTFEMDGDKASDKIKELTYFEVK